MSFADDLARMFAATGDVKIIRARLGKGDASRTIWVPVAQAEVPGGSLAYIHTDDGDADSLQSRPTEDSTALNLFGLLQYGAPIIVAETKGARYRVIRGYDTDALPGFVSASGQRSVGAPLHEHGTFSNNPAWLDSRQIVNMSVQPGAGFDLTVQLIATTNRTVYLDAGGAPRVLANNIDIDLSASAPATPGAARFVTISLDLVTGAAITTDGPEFTPLPSTLPVIRDVLAANLIAPSSGLGVGVVYLANGQTGVGHEHIRSIERGTSSAASAGAVLSVFTRTGNVVLEAGDAAASLIGNDSTALGSTVLDALDNHDAQLTATMQNTSGGNLLLGALVVLDVGAQTFTTTPTAGDPDARLVLLENIDNNASGKVAVAGYATVLVQGTVAVGDMLGASATAGRAEARTAGAGFGVALTANASGAGDVLASLGVLEKQPACYAYSSVAQVLPLSTFTDVTLNAELYDSDNMHSTSVNNERITIPADGKYIIHAGIVMELPGAAAVGAIRVENQSAAVLIEGQVEFQAAYGTMLYSKELPFTAGEWIKMKAYCNSPVTRVIRTGQKGQFLIVRRISD